MFGARAWLPNLNPVYQAGVLNTRQARTRTIKLGDVITGLQSKPEQKKTRQNKNGPRLNDKDQKYKIKQSIMDHVLLQSSSCHRLALAADLVALPLTGDTVDCLEGLGVTLEPCTIDDLGVVR
jgi:hypothetical protein